MVFTGWNFSVANPSSFLTRYSGSPRCASLSRSLSRMGATITWKQALSSLFAKMSTNITENELYKQILNGNLTLNEGMIYEMTILSPKAIEKYPIPLCLRIGMLRDSSSQVTSWDKHR